MPLKREGRVIGALNLERPSGERFRDAEIMAMETLAGQVATALDNAHLYARSRQTVRELSDSLAQLRLAQAQLIQSAKLAAVGQLAAGVAHEINNPLTTIAGLSELMLPDLPEAGGLRDDMALILRETQRARSVVRRLLDFSRHPEPHRDLTDLNALVHDTVLLIYHAAIARNIYIAEAYAEDLPPTQLDANRMKQVALNLLNNAVQAIARGGHIYVDTGRSRRDAAPGVWLRVRDTGCGISPENMERIFEPFFTTKSPNEGTGLGLSVSYGIVQDHGGIIEVESIINQGSTFTVWLPVAGRG
ncbi:MAG: hypothetical protein HY872_00735 [Chloroflexi bacterium]|nr:hypothetical protein [Chloroflexota bacterium]MBI5290387.1 hypothetical protein [Chloroflexota bacterium]